MNKSKFSGSSRGAGAAEGDAKAKRPSHSNARQQAERYAQANKPHKESDARSGNHFQGEGLSGQEQQHRNDKHSRNDKYSRQERPVQGRPKHRNEASAASRGDSRRSHADKQAPYGRNADFQDSRQAQKSHHAEHAHKPHEGQKSGRSDNRLWRDSDAKGTHRPEMAIKGEDNRRADTSSDARRFERPARGQKAESAREFAYSKSPAARGSQRRHEATEFDATPKSFDEKEQRLNETRLYGINACRETFKYRRDEVIKLYLDKETAPQFADVMKHLARTRKAYHVVESDELERIVGSQHHGGVVMVVRRKPVSDVGAYLARERNKTRDCLLALDGVGNPHNLGAIMRSCAHFGISGIVMTEAGLLQSGAAARTAEGGMEHVEGISTVRLTDALQACRDAGYTIITTSSHGGVSLYASKLPAKVVVVFGEEMDGVSKAVASRADIGVQIPGSGLVESLNVSVAASLILGEWYRQQL